MKKQERETGKDYEKELKEFKEKYELLAKQYSLPKFKQLNDDFDISKIDTNTETLLRDVRKMMVGKLSSVLQFVELLLNPSSGSMFHMFLVRGITNGEKERLDKLFEVIGAFEIDSFELDITYNEKKEAEFIKNTFSSWQTMKPELEGVISSLKQNWRKTTDKKGKSYFG